MKNTTTVISFIILGVVVGCILIYSKTSNQLSVPLDASHLLNLVRSDNNHKHVIRRSKDVLLHPKSTGELWLQINKGFIIRRLAYHDTRTDNHSVDIVRFLAMYDRRQKDTPKTLYVKLFYTDSSSSNCLVSTYEPGFLKGTDVYVLYVMTVFAPRGNVVEDFNNEDTSSHAIIYTDENCLEYHSTSQRVFIQATNELKNEEKYTYGVCLHKALLNNIDPQVLLDWVKLNIGLGAQIITVYLQNVRQSMYTILDPYIKSGIVEVIDWKLEPPLTYSRSSSQGQTGVISECIWYNMNRVQYLGLYDLDEFIVPLNHSTVQEMIKDIESRQVKVEGSRPPASYLFWNANMYDNGRPITSIEKASKLCPQYSPNGNYYKLPVYFKRSQSCLVQKTDKMKMIVRTNAVYTAWSHCLVSYRDNQYNKEYIVPPKLGQSLHYRPTWRHYEGSCTHKRKRQTTIDRFFTKITGCPSQQHTSSSYYSNT